MVDLYSIIDMFRRVEHRGYLAVKGNGSYTSLPSDEIMMCNVIRYGRTKRSITDKWFLPKDQYEAPTYPPYCYGTAWLMSMNVVKKLYETSKSEAMFRFDDVMITGFFRQIACIRLLHIGHHVRQHSGPQVTKNGVIFLTKDPDTFWELWLGILGRSHAVKMWPKLV
jgi:beta-1,3-galactosyltransferase 1